MEEPRGAEKKADVFQLLKIWGDRLCDIENPVRGVYLCEGGARDWEGVAQEDNPECHGDRKERGRRLRDAGEISSRNFCGFRAEKGPNKRDDAIAGLKNRHVW